MSQSSTRPLLPRWTVLVLWPALLLFVHLGVPASLSTLRPRVGWRRGKPGALNLLLGALLIVPGLIWLGWSVYCHFVHSANKRVRARSPLL
jgi:hypothetical protein